MAPPKISEGKLTSFVVGSQKKTRFQKEKEAREAKKQQEMKDAASVYEDFVASFNGDDAGSKTFVRGGGAGGGGFSDSGGGGRRGDTYRMDGRRSGDHGSRSGPPAPPSSSPASAGKPRSEMEKLLEEMKASKERDSKYGGDRDRSRDRDRDRSNFSSSADRGGASGSSSGGRPRRAIDSFLDEIKGRQDGSAPPLTPGKIKGSFDDGDPETTNLYVGNLAPTITEESLHELFSQFGQIYSVKIMWPRTEEERARKRNCGFVSFMQRADADDAKATMHDQEIEGYRVSIGWGKAIKKLNAAASTLGSQGGFLKPTQDSLPPGLPQDLQDKLQSAVKAAKEAADTPTPVDPSPSKARNWDAAPSAASERELTEKDTRVVVRAPEDRTQRALLDRLARYIAKDGLHLENMLREREAANPKYACLHESNSADGIYYRWKVYSLLMGDKEHRWRERPFQMTQDGPFWVPPPMQHARDGSSSDEDERRERDRRREREKERLRQERYQYATGAQLEKAREREREQRKGEAAKMLTDAEYDEFADKLRDLTPSRQLVKEAMGFALDFAEAAEEVVQLLKESLLVDETPINVKVARLFLLSDVLHNSSAPVRNASAYRTLLQGVLPEIFEHLNHIYRNVSGRMTARSMEERVMGLLSVWQEWSLYPPSFIQGLEATFQRKSGDLDALPGPGVDTSGLDLQALQRKARTVGVHFDPAVDDALSLLRKLNHVTNYAAKQAGLGGLLGAPGGGLLATVAAQAPADPTALLASMASGGAGPPASGAWATLDDVDGEAMDGEEDVDGEAMDDVDGAPMSAAEGDGDGGNGVSSFAELARMEQRKRARALSSGSSSDEAEDAAPGKIQLDDDAPVAKRPREGRDGSGTGGVDRTRLREVETQVLQLRDELEASGQHSADAVDEACAAKRAELLAQPVHSARHTASPPKAATPSGSDSGRDSGRRGRSWSPSPESKRTRGRR